MTQYVRPEGRSCKGSRGAGRGGGGARRGVKEWESALKEETEVTEKKREPDSKGKKVTREPRLLDRMGEGSVRFKIVFMRSEKPICVPPVSLANVRRIDDGRFSLFQGRSSSASTFHASLLRKRRTAYSYKIIRKGSGGAGGRG